VIANEFSEATTKLYTSALMETAFILLGITLLLNILARGLVWSVSLKFKAAR
jgi:phosphate transport system permease protein